MVFFLGAFPFDFLGCQTLIGGDVTFSMTFSFDFLDCQTLHVGDVTFPRAFFFPVAQIKWLVDLLRKGWVDFLKFSWLPYAK